MATALLWSAVSLLFAFTLLVMRIRPVALGDGTRNRRERGHGEWSKVHGELAKYFKSLDRMQSELKSLLQEHLLHFYERLTKKLA